MEHAAAAAGNFEGPAGTFARALIGRRVPSVAATCQWHAPVVGTAKYSGHPHSPKETEIKLRETSRLTSHSESLASEPE